jgi:xanthine/uracil permease
LRIIVYFLVWVQILVTCWFQVALSFCPPRYLEKIFPPVVTGPTVILIGVALITTGIEEWGGGTYCATQVLTTKALCTGNGDVVLPFGHKFYLGLGLVVFFTLLLVELFGSAFMRNTQVCKPLAFKIESINTSFKLVVFKCELLEQ